MAKEVESYLKDLVHQLKIHNHLGILRHGTGKTYADYLKLVDESEDSLHKWAEDLKHKEEDLQKRELEVYRKEQVVALRDLTHKLRALKAAGQDFKDVRVELNKYLDHADDYVKNTVEYKEAFDVK